MTSPTPACHRFCGGFLLGSLFGFLAMVVGFLGLLCVFGVRETRSTLIADGGPLGLYVLSFGLGGGVWGLLGKEHRFLGPTLGAIVLFLGMGLIDALSESAGPVGWYCGAGTILLFGFLVISSISVRKQVMDLRKANDGAGDRSGPKALYFWLKSELQQLALQRTPPSPLMRKVGKGMQILFLLCLAGFLVWRVVLHLDVTRQLDRIRAAGFPAMGSDMDSWQTVPDAENGALVLTQAFALFRTFPDGRSNEVREASLLLRTNRWSPSVRGMVATYAETNQAALAKVQEGLRYPRYRYPVDYSYGLDSLNPHLGPLRDTARIAALQAVLECEEGKIDLLAAKIELQLQLSRTLELAPTALAYLTRSGMIRTAARTTERCLNQATLNGEACTSLQTAFARIAATNLLPNALIGERAVLAPFFRMTWKQLQNSNRGSSDEELTHMRQQLYGKPSGVIWWSGILERDLRFFLQTMEQGIALAALPCPQSLSLTNLLKDAENQAWHRKHLFAGLMLPSLSSLARREASMQAVVRLTQTALAVERFRLRTGKVPTALSELVPDCLPRMPEDPFDGAPPRYRPLPTGYLVYSVGEDGRDDGGREPPARKKSTDKSTYDLTFVVER